MPLSETTPYSPCDKAVFLRLYRLGAIPTAVFQTEILREHEVPVLVIEYGNVTEARTRVPGAVPRVRLASPWARWLPRRLRPLPIAVVTLGRLLCWFMRQGRPRLLVAEGLQEQAIALVLYRVLRVSYVVHVHEVADWRDLSLVNRVFFLLEGSALRNARFLIFSEKTRSEIYRRRYRLTGPILHAFNCPRLRQARRGDTLARTLNAPADALFLLYIGGIGRNNALEEAIGALREADRVHLVLVGWGDPAYRGALEAFAAREGVGNRVHFLGEVADKWEILDRCHVGYCVYRPTELRLRHLATASNKLMESLAAGLAVIASDQPDFRDVVERYDVGLCVPIGREGVGRALRRLSERDTLERCSQNALRSHRTEFHYEHQFALALPRYLDWFPEAAVPEERTASAATGRPPSPQGEWPATASAPSDVHSTPHGGQPR